MFKSFSFKHIKLVKMYVFAKLYPKTFLKKYKYCTVGLRIMTNLQQFTLYVQIPFTIHDNT